MGQGAQAHNEHHSAHTEVVFQQRANFLKVTCGVQEPPSPPCPIKHPSSRDRPFVPASPRACVSRQLETLTPPRSRGSLFSAPDPPAEPSAPPLAAVGAHPTCKEPPFRAARASRIPVSPAFLAEASGPKQRHDSTRLPEKVYNVAASRLVSKGMTSSSQGYLSCSMIPNPHLVLNSVAHPLLLQLGLKTFPLSPAQWGIIPQDRTILKSELVRVPEVCSGKSVCNPPYLSSIIWRFSSAASLAILLLMSALLPWGYISEVSRGAGGWGRTTSVQHALMASMGARQGLTIWAWMGSSLLRAHGWSAVTLLGSQELLS